MRLGLILSLGFLLISCKPPAAKPTSTATNNSHPETANVQAASLVGYDGKAIKSSLDGIIDANKQKNQDIQNAAESQ